MDIKRSTFYYKPKGKKETDIKKKIEDISREHPYYGYRRTTAQLRRDKVIVNHKKVIDSHAFTGVVLTLTDYRLSRLAGNWLSSPPLQMGSSR